MTLYRKYRPKTFSEVVGQEHVVQTLTNAIKKGMISHAYLFSGPRGVGKTTVARLLAKAVNCKEEGVEPCNECSSCKEINQGKAVDLIEIDAASHRGIDEIRELRDGIKFSPARAEYRVFIIDESHQLTKAAANALLKTLEEPPEHAIFVLATTEIHKMIPTIVSRCQQFDFRKLTLDEIIKRLQFISKSEKAKVEKSALELIALNSEGSIRDGEGFLDQALTFAGTNKRIRADQIKDLLGLIETRLVSQFTDLILKKDIERAIKFLNDTLEKGKDPQEVTKALIDYLRKALIVKVTGIKKRENSIIAGLTKEEFKKLKEQANDFEEEELSELLELFSEAKNKMRYSSIPQLPLELAIVDFLEE